MQEILHYDRSLRIWFDRDISFAVGEGLSADIVSLPHLVPSRSNERLNEDSCITGKQSVKLTLVERAIYRIGRDAAVPSEGDSFMLEKVLNTDY
jgi:hypothetical protein